MAYINDIVAHLYFSASVRKIKKEKSKWSTIRRIKKKLKMKKYVNNRHCHNILLCCILFRDCNEIVSFFKYYSHINLI